MKKLLFLLSFIAIAICFNPLDVSAQKRAYDIAINVGQDPDTIHAMVSETATTKYRYGRFKSINTVTQRNLITGYKEYAAIVNQAGTAAPTATVVANTLGGTVVLARTSAGLYTLTLVAAFTASKTLSFGQISVSTGDLISEIVRTSADVITITLLAADDSAATDLVGDMSLTIRVYN